MASLFHLTWKEYDAFRRDPTVVADVLALTQRLDETGERHRLVAAKMLEETMMEVASIAKGEAVGGLSVSPSDRLKAAELLARWAGLDKKEAPAVQVNIQTNLDGRA